MVGEPDGANAPLNHTRQVTIDALCEHFANDVMSIEEFEKRVESAHAATTSDELQELLRDLPSSGGLPAVRDAATGAPAPRREYSVASPAQVKEREFVVAVLGGSNRAGRWRPARKNFAVAVCGGAELDFREAIMGPGVTELQIYTMWGGVEVIVPPGLNVESHGIALMGGFEHAGDQLHSPDPDAPTLRITGLALMAGVDISVRHSGETASDARRRRKLERREQRRRLRGG
jgi:hypothetical protein